MLSQSEDSDRISNLKKIWSWTGLAKTTVAIETVTENDVEWEIGGVNDVHVVK